MAAPPERVESARVCPARIGVAMGGVVMVGVPLAMLNEIVALPVPLPFVAETSTGKFPAAVGVPVMAPVVGSRVNPSGSAGSAA